MTDEQPQSFLELGDTRVLESDDSDELALVLTARSGESFRCRFPPAAAADLAAKMIYASRNRFEAHGEAGGTDKTRPMIPLPVHELRLKQGRHDREIMMMLSVGQIQLTFTMDVDAMVNAYGWLARHIESDSDVSPRRQ